jgi:hypothetical protein
VLCVYVGECGLCGCVCVGVGGGGGGCYVGFGKPNLKEKKLPNIILFRTNEEKVDI